MRVRPMFWWLLALTCLGVLLFASVVHFSPPVIIQVQATHTHPTSEGFETALDVQLSDAQGFPIDRAKITPDAHMTNMVMSAEHAQVFWRGHGQYHILIPLSMSGPWAIHLVAFADDFDTQQQNVLIQIA